MIDLNNIVLYSTFGNMEMNYFKNTIPILFKL
jgi:hypothetical protein